MALFTILLVDDDEDDISIFKEVVSTEIDNTINIVSCTHGKHCLDTLLDIIPDIIFLDINMPIMGGKECFDKIKSDDRYKNIPVVMYSTSSNPKEIAYYQSRGASYLNKPITFKQFVAALKVVLASHMDKIKNG